MAGILPDQDGFSLLLTCVKTMIFLDKEGIQFLLPFATMLRGLCDDLLGVIPKDVKQALEQNKSIKSLLRSEALKDDKKKELHGVFRDYFDSVVKNNIVKVMF